MKTTSTQQSPGVFDETGKWLNEADHPPGDPTYYLERALIRVLDVFAPRRAYFTKAAWKDYHRTVIKRYDGYCPCCRKNKLIDRFGGFIERGVELDHFHGRHQNTVHDGWPVCAPCNSRLKTDGDFKQRSAARFQVFQSNRRDICGGGSVPTKLRPHRLGRRPRATMNDPRQTRLFE